MSVNAHSIAGVYHGRRLRIEASPNEEGNLTVAATLGCQIDGADTPCELHLSNRGKGYELTWLQQSSKKPLEFHIDFFATLKQWKSFPIAKQGGLNQAVGKKSKQILDATGGWGDDAWLLALQGYAVNVCEREPLMALLLAEAFERVHRQLQAHELPIQVPKVIAQNSIEFLGSLSRQGDSSIDCVYLDPMFPPKRKKSAVANKKMQLLQWLLDEDLDSTELLQAARNTNTKRVVVKRPAHATPLLEPVSERFSSKLIHYDLYLDT